MSGRGSNTRGGRGKGGGGRANEAVKQGGRGQTAPSTPVARGFNSSSPPPKGLGRGITPVKLYEISQSSKDELLALEKERDKIKEQQFENRLKSETEKKNLKDLEGSEILLQREITKLEHHNSKSKIDDTKLVESLLKKNKDEFNALLNDKKSIKKALEDFDKEEATLKQRFDANKSKLEKKKEDLAKERQKYHTDKSKNQKAAPDSLAKVDPTPSIHPCQLEIETCDKLVSTLRRITGEKWKRTKKNENGKIQTETPQEEIVEEEQKPSDDTPVSFNWVQVFSLERISCTIPKTIGEAKELIPVVQDRKTYFYNLGVPPEKQLKKRSQNGKKEETIEVEGDLPTDEEKPDVEEEPAEEEPAEELDAEEPAEELDAEEPAEEEPAEELDAEEPAEEPAEVEPAEEEQVAEELVVDGEEPLIEEMAAEDTVEEEPAVDETVEEEPGVDETVEEEQAVDEEEQAVDEEEQAVDEEEPAVDETVEEEQDVVEEETVGEDGEQATKEDETGNENEEEFTMLGGDEDDV